MPSKVILAPRGKRLTSIRRLLRIAFAFSVTSLASYCGVSNISPGSAHHAVLDANHIESPAP